MSKAAPPIESGDRGAEAEKEGIKPRPILALLPLLLLLALVAVFLKAGPAGVFPGKFPPVEQLSFGRVTLDPGRIKLVVTNGGPSPVRISQVLVEGAYWQFTTSSAAPVPRLGSRILTLRYPWVPGEPLEIKLVSSTGLTFTHTINVAAPTPKVDVAFLWAFALLGTYIGLVPVLLGMTWMPFLRTLPAEWLNFFMAFTVGVLLFLGIETLNEAIAKAGALPAAFGGIGVVTFGAVGAFALIFAASRKLQRRRGANARMITALTVAAGIGLHNLGEGLAVGAAYRLGEIALGSFLVIGFAVHNTTEGMGIVSILGRTKTPIMSLLGLGFLAGLPTIAGAWIGAFFYSPLLAAAFLAIATGAIAEVVVDVLAVVRKQSPGGLSAPPVLAGIATGVVLMYLTGILVAA